jgi:hypothetical protein
MESFRPNVLEALSPLRNMNEDVEQLRNTRISLGGDGLRTLDLQLDILASAYPREGSFLAQENAKPADHNISPRNAIKKQRMNTHTGFFHSETEREYAKSVMQELVQIYILQGIHGKDAFKSALTETRRRVHVRRGENMPDLPPPIATPPLEDMSPRFVDHSSIRPVTPKQVTPRNNTAPEVVVSSSTPARVKSLVTAIEKTPKQTAIQKSVRKTPGSSARIKLLGESIEAAIAAGTPGKRKPVEPMDIETVHSPVGKNKALVEAVSVKRSTRKQKEAVVEAVSPPETTASETRRPRRAAALAAAEELTDPSPRRTKTAAPKPTKKRKTEPVPEEPPKRPTRRAAKKP